MSMLLHPCLLEPLAPLVLRSGRPFGAGHMPETLRFPWPSTIAGALRAAYAEQQRWDFNDPDTTARLLKTTTCGLFLVERRRRGEALRLALPRPQDAVLRPSGGLIRLVPGERDDDEWLDLPDGLAPVVMQERLVAKRGREPHFWYWETMAAWLLGDTSLEHGRLGPLDLPVDVRTHVVADPATGTALHGGLFQTAGLDFSAQARGPAEGWHDESYGLLGAASFELAPTYQRVGGEGRVSRLEPVGRDLWPAPGPELLKRLSKAERVRLVLVTPALFGPSVDADGSKSAWRPAWLDRNLTGSPPGLPGLRLRLVAAAFDRWQPVSGWDLSLGKMRAVRRAVPAGSVFWFDVRQGSEHLADLWMQSIADDPQDRRDGFGTVLVGSA